MTTYNTGNPIGSTDSRDRLDNTENMDYLENSTTELTHADRLGAVRKTRHGMEVEHDAQIAAHEIEHDAQMQAFESDFDGRLAGMAFTRVGSFTTGATLTDMRQVLIWEVSQGGDGHEYSWAGTFPKVVAAGATPATSGGIVAGAWVDRTDLTLRSELTSPAGAAMVHTTHRGNLASDLNKVDRRSDGYATIADAFEGARDVIIDSDLTISAPIVLENKALDGIGGTISTINTRGIEVGSNSSVKNIKISGDVTPAGAANYSIFMQGDSISAENISADNSTGAVFIHSASNFRVTGVKGESLVYHPSLVAGGYSALVESSNYGIIDGVISRYSGSSDTSGRHMLYLSVDQSDPKPSRGVIATNMTAQYIDRDDRNMSGIVLRSSSGCIISNYTIDGANSGVAYSQADGDIEYLVDSNSNAKIIKYDSNAVYGHSVGLSSAAHNVIGCVIANKTINVSPKSSLGIYTSCHAISVAAKNSLFSNIVTAVPGESSPILVADGSDQLLFSNIVDIKLPDSGGSQEAMFNFTGACANVSISNIKTSRSLFKGLNNVTDLSVDFSRKASVFSTSDVITTSDTNGLISSVTKTSQNTLEIVFNSHVTAKAVATATVVSNRIIAPHVFISSISGKTIAIQFFSVTGVSSSLSSIAAGADIMLNQ